MKTMNDVNPAQAYFEGMLWAAFGVRILSDNVAGWQIEAVKKYATKLKEEERGVDEINRYERDYNRLTENSV